MKRSRKIALAILILILAAYCILPKSNINRGDEVELVLIYDNKDIHVILPDDEANKVRKILDSNVYNVFPDTPACGFMTCYGFRIGDNFFSMPIDSCNNISDNKGYFRVWESEMDYLHSLFDQYKN